MRYLLLDEHRYADAELAGQHVSFSLPLRANAAELEAWADRVLEGPTSEEVLGGSH